MAKISFYCTCQYTPIGYLAIYGDDHSVRAIDFLEENEKRHCDISPVLDLCVKELQAYFAGNLTKFTVPYKAAMGTDFQEKVWKKVCEVPYGQTKTYGDIAKELGDIKLARAVGLANGSNPIPIIIPCHRIIGQNGKLTGYGGGLWRKEWLLRHEARYSGNAELFQNS